MRVQHEPRHAVGRIPVRVGRGTAEHRPELPVRVRDAEYAGVAPVEDVLGLLLLDRRSRSRADSSRADRRGGGVGAAPPMHVASGTSPGFCVGGAGTPYSSVSTSEDVRSRSGEDDSSDLVLDRLHETIELAVPSFVNTARELTKCSVPPPAPSNWSSGVTAGITEKPVPPSGPLGPLAVRADDRDRNGRGTRGELELRQRVDVHAVEVRPEEVEHVRGHVEAVAVGSDVRKVREALSGLTPSSVHNGESLVVSIR